MSLLYHITHIRNLPGILASGGLCCDRLRESSAMQTVGIAHQHIKDRRKRRAVCGFMGQPVAAGGTLWDYVPFYFAPRSPMLYSIHMGNVEGYKEGQGPVLYLVTSIETSAALNRAFAFTDGHAEMGFSQFSDDLGELDTLVDWSIMNGKYWNDTDEQPDRKRKRQAEFLVYEFFPWSALKQIGVYDHGIAQEVEGIVGKEVYRPEVFVRRDWYY